MTTERQSSTEGSERAEVTTRLRRAVGRLSTTALARMDREMGWFRELEPQERSAIGMIVQAGIATFVDWYSAAETPGAAVPDPRAAVFGAVPHAFARRISLQRTVAMVRLSIEVVEQNLADVLGPADAKPVLEAITHYGREVAFATAEIYARAAEMRGAWDARLEALIVDSLLRGDADLTEVESRAGALGWNADDAVATVLGPLPDTPDARAEAPEEVRRIAADHGLHTMTAAQGDRMLVILGGRAGTKLPRDELAAAFGEGPVVVGPVLTGLAQAATSAAAALAGYRSAVGWAEAPRPVDADDLLPERALDHDPLAVDHLLVQVHRPVAAAGAVVRETLRAYLDGGGNLEATARTLFVHVNTVRYRLRRAHEVTGLDPANARDAYTLRVALTLGRLQDARHADL